MATKEDYEKRLMAAAVRVVRAEAGYTISASDNLPGAIKELAAILAEQDARIEALEDVAHTPSREEDTQTPRCDHGIPIIGRKCSLCEEECKKSERDE